MSCVLYGFCLKKQEGKVLAIHIALIDKSEVIHKMLLHCLYYYTVQVHRFNSLEEYSAQFKDNQPRLIFIDWELKRADRPLIYTARDQFQFIPLVLLYRQDLKADLLNLPKDKIPYRIKKPLNPKEIRDICVKLIPELKNSTLHSFLKFPKSEEEKKQEEQNKPSPPQPKQTQTEELQEEPAEDKTKSFIGSLIEKTKRFIPAKEEIETVEEFPEKENEASLNPKQPVGQGFQTSSGLTSVARPQSSENQDLSAQSTSSPKKRPAKDLSEPVKTVDTTLTDQTPLTTRKTVDTTLTDQTPPTTRKTADTALTDQTPLTTRKTADTAPTDQTPPITRKTADTAPTDQTPPITRKTADTALTDQTPPAVRKTSDQNLDYLAEQLKEAGSVTKSPSKKSKVIKTKDKIINKENINIDEDTQNDLAPMAIKSSSLDKKPNRQNLTKQDLLQVFDKYKDSLEFQKLMEKILSEHIQSAVAGILKGDSVKSALQKPLADFKESAQFKKLVEKEISQYMQKQLPLVIKSIVENEIKKIIGD